MPTVVLLRHGQASFGAEDYDALSDLGRRQSAEVGAHLAGRGLRDPLWRAGSLRRQRDTATIAMAAGGFTGDLGEDPRLDEYDHVGMVRDHAAATGQGPPADPRAFQDLLDTALRRWVDAGHPEGWGAFAGGALAAVAEVGTSLPAGRDAVVVTSGGVIAAVCTALLGGGADTVIALNRVTVNAGLTTILSGSGGLTVLTFNDQSHFAGDQARDLRTYR